MYDSVTAGSIMIMTIGLVHTSGYGFVAHCHLRCQGVNYRDHGAGRPEAGLFTRPKTLQTRRRRRILTRRLRQTAAAVVDDASATVAVSNALVGTTPDEAREQQPQQQQQPQRPQQRQPQQPQNVFLGAEDVAERLAGGEGLNCDDGVVHSSGKAGVFYNRVGAINRDLSVLMANVLAEERIAGRYGKKKKRRRMRSTPATSATADNGAAKSSGVTSAGDVEEEGLVVLDAFAASGVRALRYLTEVPGVRKVVANDHDTAAIHMIRRAAAEVCGTGADKLEVHHDDALDTMYAARSGGLGTYDIIDIDPYGCAAGYLDAAVEAVTDGGLLCITSTDMPVLSGAQPAAAYSRYGSVPTRAGYHDEMSLRILLHATSAAAGRHRRSIKPVLSIAIDHYVRVFVRVFRSPDEALKAAQSSVSYVLQSEMCPSFFLLPAIPAKKTASRQKKMPSSPPRSTAENNSITTVHRSAESSGDAFEIETQKESSTPRGSTLNFVEDQSRTKEHTEREARFSQPPLPRMDGEATATADVPSPGGACPETGGALMLGGPIWSGPLHDQAWVNRAIALASFIPTTMEAVGITNGSPSEGQGKGVGVSAPVCASSIGRGGETNGDISEILLSSVDKELLLAAEVEDKGKGENVPISVSSSLRHGREESSSNNPWVDQDPLLFVGTASQQSAIVPPTSLRLAAGPRAESLLRAVSQELNNVPLFYNLKDMFATIGLARHPKREQVMGALDAAGYRTSGMHKEPLALKTNAPDAAVWDVLRCWLRDNPQTKSPNRAAGVSIVERGPQLINNANFDAAERIGLGTNGGREATPDRGGFLHTHNPERRWGPLSRGTVMSEG